MAKSKDRDRIPCPECDGDVPLTSFTCPHCGDAHFYPNVTIANQPGEVKKLDERYAKAQSIAKKRNATAQLDEFEEFVKEKAVPVVARPLAEIQRLATSDRELVATYAARGAMSLDHGSHVLRGDKWKSVRIVAETAFYGSECQQKLHFATLSPDDEGLSNYGNCSVTLKTKMVSKRTAVFEENMIKFWRKNANKHAKGKPILDGYIADWKRRGKLALSKHAKDVNASTGKAEFPGILLTAGATSADDEFIELHIVGHLTVKAFEKVVLTSEPKKTNKSTIKALRQNLQKHGVKWEDRSTTSS